MSVDRSIETSLERIASALEFLANRINAEDRIMATMPVQPVQPEQSETVAKPPRARKAKPVMAPPIQEPEPEPIPTTITPVVLNETESAAEVMAVAGEFVRRFQNEQPSGQEQARKMLQLYFKGKKIRELDHTERIDFIAMMREKLDGVAL